MYTVNKNQHLTDPLP